MNSRNSLSNVAHEQGLCLTEVLLQASVLLKFLWFEMSERPHTESRLKHAQFMLDHKRDSDGPAGSWVKLCPVERRRFVEQFVSTGMLVLAVGVDLVECVFMRDYLHEVMKAHWLEAQRPALLSR